MTPRGEHDQRVGPASPPANRAAQRGFLRSATVVPVLGRRGRRPYALVMLGALVVLLLGGAIVAQAAGRFDIAGFSTGGGGRATGGSFVLNGSAARSTDTVSSGGGFTIQGGVGGGVPAGPIIGGPSTLYVPEVAVARSMP